MTAATKIQTARKIPGAKIAVYDDAGNAWVLRHKFAHRDCPKLIETLHKIRDAGEVNLTHWRRASKGED